MKEQIAALVLKVNTNQGYGVDQINTQVTLGDLLASIEDAISQYGEDTKVVLDAGQQYGASFGSIRDDGSGQLFTDPEFDEDADQYDY